MAIYNGEDVAVCIVGIACASLGSDKAGDTSHCVVEEVAGLATCVGYLLADVKLVPFSHTQKNSCSKTLLFYCKSFLIQYLFFGFS